MQMVIAWLEAVVDEMPAQAREQGRMWFDAHVLSQPSQLDTSLVAMQTVAMRPRQQCTSNAIEARYGLEKTRHKGGGSKLRSRGAKHGGVFVHRSLFKSGEGNASVCRRTVLIEVQRSSNADKGKVKYGPAVANRCGEACLCGWRQRVSGPILRTRLQSDWVDPYPSW